MTDKINNESGSFLGSSSSDVLQSNSIEQKKLLESSKCQICLVNNRVYYVFVRPGLEDFIKQLNKKFNI